MLDIAGVDISGATQVVQSIKAIVDAGRRTGIPVVFLQMGHKPDLRIVRGARTAAIAAALAY